MTARHDQHWRDDPVRNAKARAIALKVVTSPTCRNDLARYYRTAGPYAGKTFAELGPVDENVITPADLLAVTTLSVKISPIAIRRFAERSDELTSLLQAVPADLTLERIEPGPQTAAMAALYEAVKKCLYRADADRGNAWVTASKICARKRPVLFPVRDRVVVKLLGLKGNYPDDWPVFAALVADEEIGAHLDEAVSEAASRDGVDVGDRTLRLRHLDVALWMSAA